MKCIALFLLLLPVPSITIAQTGNVLNTAVPFLRIIPDARAGGMGDAGIATSPDAHSIFWNTAKLAFIQNRFGVSTTYTAWLGKSGLLDASTYWKVDSNNAVTGSIRYFNFPELTFTDFSGNVIGTYRPVEYTMHLGYSRKFSRHLSGGFNFGYVRSAIPIGYSTNGIQRQAASTLMTDVNVFYTHPITKNSVFTNYNIGLAVSNLGGKLSYDNLVSNGNFLPANIAIGSSFDFQFGKDHQLTFTTELKKLLVPTPDTAGNFQDQSVVEGIFKSFGDAPGGIHEELREVDPSLGAEYWWKKMIALRTGYFYESKYKGNRQYLTIGAGIRYHVIQFEYSYLITTTKINGPLDGTMRFGLSCDLNTFRKNHSKKP